VLELLTATADRIAHDSSAELVSADQAGVRYRVTASLSTLSGRSPLLQGLLEALAGAGIALGEDKARGARA
jgi:hypothetical protein